ICATNKHYNRALYETHGSLTTEQPNKRVSTDICGPFTIQSDDDKTQIYVLNFIDNCTRFVSSKIIKNIQASTIATAFEKEWIIPFVHLKKSSVIKDNNLLATLSPNYVTNT
ncbi:hypothetical protein M153_201670003, partial [Pseudoloma neurophilia]